MVCLFVCLFFQWFLLAYQGDTVFICKFFSFRNAKIYFSGASDLSAVWRRFKLRDFGGAFLYIIEARHNKHTGLAHITRRCRYVTAVFSAFC